MELHLILSSERHFVVLQPPPLSGEHREVHSMLVLPTRRGGETGENTEIKSQRLCHWTPAGAWNWGSATQKDSVGETMAEPQGGTWDSSTFIFPLGQFSNLKIQFCNLSKIPLKSNMKKMVVIGAHKTVNRQHGRDDPQRPVTQSHLVPHQGSSHLWDSTHLPGGRRQPPESPENEVRWPN